MQKEKWGICKVLEIPALALLPLNAMTWPMSALRCFVWVKQMGFY